MRKTGKKTFGSLLRTVLLGVLAILLLVCLVSCGGKDGEVSESASPVEDNAIAKLLVGNLSSYQVVRPETMNGDELKAVLAFVDVLQQKGYPEVAVVSDYVALAPITDYEIIVGDTTRKGSVYNEGEGAVVETEAYSICIVENRLIFTYADTKGLIDGLEYILFSVIDAEQADIRETYDMELFEREVKRYSFDQFSVKTYIGDGSVFTLDKNVRFIGTAKPDSTVTVQLAKGFEALSSFDATAGADGVWIADVTPNADADSVMIRIDGNIAEKYSDISFKENKINACSEGTKVYINGTQVDVHANEGGNYVVSSLAEGQTEMEIKLVRRYKVDDYVIRPQSAGIESDVNGKEITFKVTKFPCKLSVEFDDFLDDPTDSVQLFLYDHEEFTPELDGRELIYFAPGEYWIDQELTLKSDTTLYLEEGAVLNARLNVTNAKNVTVCGRGIIDTYYFKVEKNMTVFEGCKNLTLKDYTLTGPRKWMTVLKECNTVSVKSLNILGTEMNSDGVDIVGSQNVTIDGCLLRTNDDCIAVKSHNSDVKNVTVKNCIMWNERWGNALEIGYETRCESISEIYFENNDLIHVSGACMSIHLGDRAAVSDVNYKNIRIENSSGKLIEYFIRNTDYTKDIEKGTIADVSIEGVEILGDSLGRIVFEGFDADHGITGVSIGKIKFNNKYLDSIDSILAKGDHLKDITYDGKSVL